MLRLKCLWANLTEMCRRELATVNLELVRKVWAGATDCKVMTLRVETDTMSVVKIVQGQRIDWRTGRRQRSFERVFLSKGFGLKYLTSYKISSREYKLPEVCLGDRSKDGNNLWGKDGNSPPSSTSLLA